MNRETGKLRPVEVVTADASKVSGWDFYRSLPGVAERIAKRERDKAKAEEMRAAVAAGDNRKAADLILEAIAEKVGIPFDELKRRTRDQWL